MKKIIPVVLILISVCAICVISCEKDPSFVRGNYVCKDSVLTPTGPQVPTVTTAEVTDISRTSAKCGGKLVSTGGSDVTSYGVCLSKTPHSIAAASNSNDGQHIGSFSSVLQNLTPGTHYYVRAYATNKVGTG